MYFVQLKSDLNYNEKKSNIFFFLTLTSHDFYWFKLNVTNFSFSLTSVVIYSWPLLQITLNTFFFFEKARKAKKQKTNYRHMMLVDQYLAYNSKGKPIDKSAKIFSQLSIVFVFTAINYNFPFECNFCILNFSTRFERNIHIKKHFKHRNCTGCHKSLIQIGDVWYELKRHFDEQCHAIKDDIDYNEVLVKTEHSQSFPEGYDESEGFSDNHSYLEKRVPLDIILVEENFIYTQNINNELDAVSIAADNLELSVNTALESDFKLPDNDILNETLFLQPIQNELLDIPEGCTACSNSVNKSTKPSKQRKIYICDVCGKQFKSKYNHDVHKTTHTNEYPLSCDICQRPFKYKELLTRHMAIHSGSKRKKCEYCERTFSSKLGLKNHILITHEGKTLFSCEKCGKTFASAGNLKIHNRIHLETRPYICNYCGRGFNSQCNLKEHCNLHTGARPYSCKECGKTFGRDSQLRAHMLVHSGKKPCKCTEEGCDRAYAYSIDLKRHRYSVHGIYTKKHICPICSKVYPENKLLKKHLETHNLVAKS